MNNNAQLLTCRYLIKCSHLLSLKFFLTYLPSSPIQTNILPGFMSLCENPLFLKCFIPQTVKQDINT